MQHVVTQRVMRLRIVWTYTRFSVRNYCLMICGKTCSSKVCVGQRGLTTSVTTISNTLQPAFATVTRATNLTCNSRWFQTMGLTANSHRSSEHAFEGKCILIPVMDLTINSRCFTAWLAPNILQSWAHERTREAGIVALNSWANP